MIKTLITTSCLVLILSTNGFTQSYRSFEWDIMNFGYATLSGDAASGGVLVATEPRYNVNDKISVGLRYELAFFESDFDFGFDSDVGH